jgi:hypothetical protein
MKLAFLSLLAVLAVGAYWTTRTDAPSIAVEGAAPEAHEGGPGASSAVSPSSAVSRGIDADARAQLDAANQRIRALEDEVARLRVELDAAGKARLARESEFLRYTQGIAQLSSLAGSPIPHFQTDALAEAASAAKAAEARAAEVRAAELRSAEQKALESAALASPTAASTPPPHDESAVPGATKPAGDAATGPAGAATGTAGAATVAVGAAPDSAGAAANSANAATNPDGAAANPAAATTPGKLAPPTPELSPSRGHAVYQELRTLFTLEQITGFDLLEAGALHVGYTGPVVMRVLDDRGRPLGVISADRLRLEASRAARMVTVVLENGCERRAGVKTAFEGGPVDADGRGGVRRIALPDCDPKPWIEAVPELFRDEDRDTSIDDGRVNLVKLRAALNQLLHVDAANGWYRVQGIGGVQANVLRDVAIDQLDRDGKIEKRLFADRMSVLREAQGLQILLLGGSQLRSDQKSAFLDGRYRIFLPRADAEAWAKAGIPGLDPAAGDVPAFTPGAPSKPSSALPADKKSGGALDSSRPAEPVHSPEPKQL